MAKGDHIFIKSRLRGIPFQHHGIDMGDGTVVHLAPESGSRVALVDHSGKFCVRRDSIDTFSFGKPVHVFQHPQPREADEVVAAATSHIGRCGYHLIDNNCEHFANLCATGSAGSRQVDFGHSTAVSMTSAVTKGLWALSGRAAARYATRAAARPHPLSMLADGVEAVTIATGCAAGLTAERTRRLARAGGQLTALAVGCAVGGPVGGAVSLAMHRSSTQIAERVCTAARSGLSLLKRQSQPEN